MRRLNKFSRLNKLAKCLCCGKLTHSSIDGALGIDLCRTCYDSAGYVNEHSDNGHEPKVTDCPTCAGVECLHAAATA